MTEKYAKALFELAKEENICDIIKNELEQIRNIIVGTPELIRILDCPGIDVEARKKVITDCFGEADKYVLNLLYILTDKRQMHLFFSLVDSYKTACGIEQVTVVTAVPMSKDEKKRLEAVLSKKRRNKIELKNEVDQSILGGVIIRFPDSVTDASLKSRLVKAKYDLHKEKKYGY